MIPDQIHADETGFPEAWPAGDRTLLLSVVKQSSAGEDVAKYPARLILDGAPSPWIVVEAEWTHKAVSVAGLWFRPGDRLLEYFSPTAWFNVFAVYDPAGPLRGWYANVTRPVTFDGSSVPPQLTWHDLFVDVVVLPDGLVRILDEDELAASALEQVEPAVYARVLLIRDQLVALAKPGVFPFLDASRT